MHGKIPHSEVIWYDSVTSSGELKWQNKLNVQNKMFFDVCDGIFLNYNWSIADLQDSVDICGAERQFDVYVGVDVFGRGCFGGGGWNTYKAMQVIREKQLSAAIFAPGWVMEKFDKKDFSKNNQKFWELLSSYLYPHYVTSLPLTSSFCRGYGDHVFIDGKIVYDDKWTNLSSQSLQPTFSSSFYQLGPKVGMKINSMEYDRTRAFNGGGCLCINGEVNPQDEQTRTVFRMYKCDVHLEADTTYFVSYTFSRSTKLVDLFLLFVYEKHPTYTVFTGTNSDKENSSIYTVPSDQSDNYNIIKCQKSNIENNWITRSTDFVLTETKHLKEIRFACATSGSKCEEMNNFKMNIGELKIGIAEDFILHPSPALNLRCRNINISTDGNIIQPTFVITWNYTLTDQVKKPKCFDIYIESLCDQGYFIKKNTDCEDVVLSESTDDEFDVVSKFVKKTGVTFVGRSFVESYFIDVIGVPLECENGLKVIVQSISETDIREDLTKSSSVTVRW